MKYWEQPYNPWIGCSKCSPGCQNCYAETLHTQRHVALLEGKKMPECYRKPFNEIQILDNRLDIPLKRKTPTVFFVCNMGDLFHPNVPGNFIAEVFTRMTLAKKHTFLVLTKRITRAMKYLQFVPWDMQIYKNVWLGTTVCTQAEADKNIPLLLQTPAAHRWLSIEPMLGPIDIIAAEGDMQCIQCQHKWHNDKAPYRCPSCSNEDSFQMVSCNDPYKDTVSRLDQVIVGGETGKNARPMHPDNVRKVRDDCKEAGVPFMFKQWGEWVVANDKNLAKNGKQWDSRRSDCIWLDIDGTIKQESSFGLSADAYAMIRVGKKKSGRLLDGVEYNDLAWSCND